MTPGSSTPPLPDWLAHRAQATPDREALVADGRSWTFAQLDADVTRLAVVLRSHGACSGDRIATLLHNGAASVLLLHAVLRLGATLVPLNVRLTAAEAAWQLRDANPRLVVVETRTAALAGSAREVWDAGELLQSGADAAPRAPLSLVHDPSHVAAIIYTSGTTGSPKGARLTVANLWWSAIGSALNLGALPTDRWLAVLPLFHVGGLSIPIRSAIGGFTAVVHDSFDPDAANRAIDDEGITVVSVVAVMLQRMLDARGARPYPATLRCVLLGGGPAPAALLDRCRTLGVPVVQTYGLTETSSQVATLPPEEASRRPGSAGKPLYPNALRIADDDGDTAAPGAEGEIQVRGPVVTAGYEGRDVAAHLTADGWFRTGDIGRIDAEGFLYVLDRRDDLIVSGGENVYPAEVEAALLSHPAVAEAGVVGLTDERWGQRVVAFVRVGDRSAAPVTPDALRDHCRTRLAGYKVPREVRIVTHELPRTASGKLRRGALRDVAAMPGA